ncbi:MAG: hypothetical protein QOK16_1770 [Solirubrobacteraceae bacterium]|nr:hypothetical protein [Solirubrobacteraceae bacterium]MEA2182672.1 hypothetical protein [Solirubrobacteraceae bacterium]MEA2186759.1 hypothetical protein [Solirubrobacteraceae bacterium]
MSASRNDREGAVDEIVLTMAGLADLAASLTARQLRRAVRPVQEIVKRSDLRELTREGHSDLKARGALALKRRLPEADVPHLEALARRADAR